MTARRLPHRLPAAHRGAPAAAAGLRAGLRQPGHLALVGALMLVGIPVLIAGVVAWVVLASLAAAKASQGQSYRYPLTLRLVR
jgi:uncharacterized Tic20 family protein